MLDTQGVPLSDDLGIDDIALTREAALIAIDLLVGDGVLILGGDVYFRRPGGIEIAYANWFTEQHAGESMDYFIERAGVETKAYIDRFPIREDMTALFAFVISKG